MHLVGIRTINIHMHTHGLHWYTVHHALYTFDTGKSNKMDTKDSLLTIDSLMKSCDRSAVLSSLCFFLAHNHWLPFFLLFIIHILFLFLSCSNTFPWFNREKNKFRQKKHRLFLSIKSVDNMHNSRSFQIANHFCQIK